MSSVKQYKGVIFDMGGVFVNFKYPEKVDELIVNIKNNPDYLKRFVDCELGKIPLSDVADFLDYAFPGLKDHQDFENLDPEVFLGSLNTDIYNAAKIIQSNGLKVGVLSNNFYLSSAMKRTAAIPEIYDFEVVESCLAGLRKPDPQIFELMLKKLKLESHQASEMIFVDDLESNVKGAENLGMTGIILKNGDSETAVNRLEELLGLKLK